MPEPIQLQLPAVEKRPALPYLEWMRAQGCCADTAWRYRKKGVFKGLYFKFNRWYIPAEEAEDFEARARAGQLDTRKQTIADRNPRKKAA